MEHYNHKEQMLFSSRLTDLLINGGFETGTLSPWTNLGPNNAEVTADQSPHSGTFVADLPRRSAIQQIVSKGLAPENVYRLSGSLSSAGDLQPESTTVVTLRFIDRNQNILEEFNKTFLRNLPLAANGNYREFNILAQAPLCTVGAIVIIATDNDGATGSSTIADDFSLVQEN